MFAKFSNDSKVLSLNEMVEVLTDKGVVKHNF